MKSYLSIDLDYWENPLKMERYLRKVLKIFPQAKIFRHHHLMLKDINKIEPDRIVNVDYHTDLASSRDPRRDRIELNEGTWGNFVKGSREEFLWVYPFTACTRGKNNRDDDFTGWCHGEGNPNPFFTKNPFPICQWRRTRRRKGRLPNPKNFVAAAISLSPQYTHHKVLKRFKEFYEKTSGIKVGIQMKNFS